MALAFPQNPAEGQVYDYPPFRYQFTSGRWLSVGRGADTVSEAIKAHESASNIHPISSIIGLQAALASVLPPVLDPKWVRKRSAMPAGYAPEDGQLLSRVLYPDAWAAIQAGLVPVCTDAEWLADPAKRGCFTPGDGSTTFRVPDTNGVYPGSYGPVYPSGGSGDGGTILRDRIQNITGEFVDPISRAASSGGQVKGAFKSGSTMSTPSGAGGGPNAGYGFTFDASLVARTGDTTRPITVEGCWAVRLFGAVQNTGSADAAALATAVAALAARVTALEARKSTCLVDATGTGAPHETVSATLPANISNNSKYDLDNPFGVSTPVWCKVQLNIANGGWFDAGWDGNSGTGSSSFGARAVVMSNGKIRVITGTIGLDVQDNLVGSGSGLPSGSAIVTSARCRVSVRRMDD